MIIFLTNLGYYFTGDAAARDSDGYYWIKGRVDGIIFYIILIDVINVSGHRLSTAEIESALIQHPSVAESAVVAVPDDITGQSIGAFVALKPNKINDQSLVKELVAQVRSVIGPFAAPKRLIIVDELPKTRSGKIVRRILKKILSGETDQLGDLSTIADPEYFYLFILALSVKSSIL